MSNKPQRRRGSREGREKREEREERERYSVCLFCLYSIKNQAIYFFGVARVILVPDYTLGMAAMGKTI